MRLEEGGKIYFEVRKLSTSAFASFRFSEPFVNLLIHALNKVVVWNLSVESTEVKAVLAINTVWFSHKLLNNSVAVLDDPPLIKYMRTFAKAHFAFIGETREKCKE